MAPVVKQVQRVLVVEDEFAIAQALRDILEGELAATVQLAGSVAEAQRLIESEPPQLVLVDIRLRGSQSGIALGQLLSSRYRIPFVYLTSHADKHTLQQAVATHPYGYVVKPFDNDEIVFALQAALAQHAIEQLRQHQTYLTEELRATHHVDDLVMQDPATEAAWQLARQVAPHDLTVLLLGETGTGKEVFARAIHAHSNRREQPLIKLNCAALPAQLIESELFGHEKGAFTGANSQRIGKFELAHQGTIFLDEVGELPLELQAKLLRVLQEKEIERVGGSRTLKVDVRIVAATNRVLEKEVAAGRFRQDLYYRLSVFPITVPPLRQRPADIAALADFFLRKASHQLGKPLSDFSSDARQQMAAYAWPGNVRELQHVVERAALLATDKVVTTLHMTAAVITPGATLADEEAQSDSPPRSLKDVEREAIIAALHYCNGRVRGENGAAAYLQIDPSTLDSRMRKLGIKRGFA